MDEVAVMIAKGAEIIILFVAVAFAERARSSQLTTPPLARNGDWPAGDPPAVHKPAGLCRSEMLRSPPERRHSEQVKN